MRHLIKWLAVVVAAIVVAVACADKSVQHNSSELPLRPVGEITLPGDNSRFDYASLDTQKGLLFVSHLGASEVIEVDIRAGRVVRTIADVSQVHGVLVVGSLNRVRSARAGTHRTVPGRIGI